MRETKANENRGELPILQPFENNPKTPHRKSGRGRIRACVLVLVHVVILLHITHYLIRGRTLSPVEPSEAMYAIELGFLNAGAIFFGLAIISTLVFGRFFCGWGCHIVALQDLCGYLLRRIGIRPKPFRSRLLTIVPFVVAFYMFCWPTVQRLWRGERHPGFTNHLLTENFWQTFPGPFISVLTLSVCGGLIVYLLGNKGFCTYGCPYGAFFSISDRLAAGRIRVTDACHQCGQCTANCTSNVVVHAEVRDFGMVVDPGCMKCMDCVSVCPNDALYFGLKNKPLSENLTGALAASSKPRRRKSYDFSISEELFALVVAAVSVFAFRGLYNGPPLLLAIALGVMTAYLAVQFGRIFRRRDLRIQNIRLKRDGQITKIGWWAVIFLVTWFAFNVHSFFAQYHRYRGREHLSRIAATWPELLEGNALQQGFTPEDRANINTALKSFQYADQIGMIDVLEIKLGLVFANIMNRDMDAAEKYLRQAYERDPSIREMLMEFLVSQDRQEEAAELFRNDL